MTDIDAMYREQLLCEARDGHTERLGELLELYRNYLRSVAGAQMEVHLQARVHPSDVVQETYLLACRHFRRFRGGGARELVAWLRRILVRRIARQVEKQLRTQKRNALREV